MLPRYETEYQRASVPPSRWAIVRAPRRCRGPRGVGFARLAATEFRLVGSTDAPDSSTDNISELCGAERSEVTGSREESD